MPYVPFVTVGGVSLHYVESGRGEPLLLLHGNAGSGRVWHKVFPALARSFRVIAHDRQGFGESEPGEPADAGPHAYARELAEFMDTLGIERAHVAGLSFGGMVAQCFALTFPQRIERLVLVGTTADRTGRDVRATLAELERDGWAAVAKRLTRSWFRPGADPADADEALTIALQSSRRMREVTVRALGSFDILSEIPGIRAPTLVVVGENDVTCPPACSRQLHASIARSRLCTVPDCAHLVPIEQPHAFSRHVLAFLLEEHPPDAATPP